MFSYINYFDACIINDELWFSNMNINALMKTNIYTGETVFVDTFPEISDTERNIHSRCLEYAGKLYFIPFHSNILHIRNLSEQKWESSVKLKGNDYSSAVISGEYIYIVPHSLSEPLIRFSPVTRKAEYITLPSEKILCSTEYTSPSSVAVLDNQLFVAPFRNCIIYRISLSDFSVKVYQLQGDLSVFSITADTADGLLWITDKNSSNVISFNPETSEKRTYTIGIASNPLIASFIRVVKITKSKILILPAYYDRLIILDTVNGTYHEAEFPLDFNRTGKFSLFQFWIMKDDVVYLFPKCGNHLLKYDISQDNAEIIHEKYTEECADRIRDAIERQEKLSLQKGILYEYECMGDAISSFIGYISSLQYSNSYQNNLCLNGRTIYDCIKEKIL